MRVLLSTVTGESVRERAWRAAAVLAAVALVATVVFGDVPNRTRLVGALLDLAHVPVFGVLALALRHLGRDPDARRRDWIAMGGVLALGVITEAAQVFLPNREPSVSDLLRDLAGGGAVLLLRVAWEERATSGPAAGDDRPAGEHRHSDGRHPARFVLLAVLLLLGACVEVGRVVAGNVQRARVMPVLARFDGSWSERETIELGDNALTWPAQPRGVDVAGARLARLDLRPATYSGLSIVEPHGDWRGYERLVLTLVSDLDAPLQVALRIHDATHDNRYRDRFNVNFVVRPGENRLVFPLEEVRRSLDTREMDMSRIRGVVLFVHRLDHPTHLYLGELRLE